jgi:hypothetical protein
MRSMHSTSLSRSPKKPHAQQRARTSSLTGSARGSRPWQSEQRIHQRHDADRESDFGRLALARPQLAGQQFQQAAARGGQHQQRRHAVAALARLGVQHDLQPALQLAAAQYHHGLAQRIDALARPTAGVFTSRSRFSASDTSRLMARSTSMVVRIGSDQRHQLHHGQLRRRQLLAAHDDGLGKVIALEIIEAQVQAVLEFFALSTFSATRFCGSWRKRGASFISWTAGYCACPS